MTAQILVPLDGSTQAESALPFDIALARLTSSGITLLRAVPSPAANESTTQATAPPVNGSEDLVTAYNYLESVKAHLEEAGMQVCAEVVEDLPVPAILECAREDPSIWLIALTGHRMSQPRPWAYGNVVERVLNAAVKPVLLVRPGVEETTGQAPEQVFDTIIVPLDGSRFAEEALVEASHLAKLTGATIALVCVVPPADSRSVRHQDYGHISGYLAREYETTRLSHYVTGVARRLRAEGFQVHTELSYGQPAETILLASRRLHGDIIILAAHGRRDLERVWLGSVAQRLVQNATLPVLIVRPPRRENSPAEIYAARSIPERQEGQR